MLHGGAGPSSSSASDSVLFSQPLLEEEEEVEHVESFLLHCNRRRAKADPWVDMFVLVSSPSHLAWHGAHCFNVLLVQPEV